MKHPTNITRAIAQIITTQYFFSSVLLKRQIIADPVSTPTASMSARGQIKYNPDWVAPLTTAQMVFLLCHECMHYMLAHCLRLEGRDPKKWNWACDAWINETLIHLRVGQFIEGGIRYAGAQNMTADELYHHAPANPPGDGGGSLGADLDTAETDTMSEAEQSVAQAEAKVELAQAAQAARQMGDLPAVLDELVARVLRTDTPWHKHLEQFMSRSLANDYSFMTPDRRFVHQGMYLPGEDGHGCGDVAIITDESMSISEAELQHFGGHVNTVLAACEPEKVFLLHTDTEVRAVEEFGPDQVPITFRRVCGGGTNMVAGLEWVQRHQPQVDAIIVLTDGYTPFGTASSIPVFWAITTDIQAPHGQTVRLKVAA